MNYKELVNKFTKNIPSHYLICSKLGSGKTTFLKYLNAELANNYEKYNIIPLFVNASKITKKQGSFIDYLLSVYSDEISDREKTENLDRKQLFKEYLNNDKYKFLLIIDFTELLDEALAEDLIKELEVFNAFKSLSIIYSTGNTKSKDLPVFINYESIDDFGILNENQICNYLNNHGFNVNYINSAWCELLNTPFFLTKFAEIYENIDVDFSADVLVVKSQLIEDYLDELIKVNNPKTEGTEYNIRRKLLYIIIPELVFEKNSQRIILPAEYDEYINNLSALNVVKDKMDSYECEISHLIYFNFFTARHIKNCFEKNDLSECIKLLNKRIFDDEILTFLGEQLELKNENRKGSELYKCLDYIRQHYNVDLYHVAVCNILNVFVNTCSEQLSGLDLSYLDLTQCDFIGIKCKNTDFSYSTLKDTCLIPNIATDNAEHFAVSEDGKYCLLAENYKFGNKYCNVNIRDTDSGELIHSFYLPNIYSVAEVDNEKYAVLYNNGIHNIIAIYKYENSICVFYTEIGKKQFEYKLIGTYENKLFYFANGVLFSVDINTKAIKNYAEFPLDIFKNFIILNKQFHENNNGIVLYNDNENINLFFISFENILNNRFDRAYEYSADKFDENAKVYFSEYEPVIAVCSDTNYEIYNYKSNSHVPDDLDDYINQSEIYCENFILYLGKEKSADNPQYINTPKDINLKLIYTHNLVSIFNIENTFLDKKYFLFNVVNKKIIKLNNMYVLEDSKPYYKADSLIIFRDERFKTYNGFVKQLIFDLNKRKFIVETLPWANLFEFRMYDMGGYKNCYLYLPNLQNPLIEYIAQFFFRQYLIADSVSNINDLDYISVNISDLSVRLSFISSYGLNTKIIFLDDYLFLDILNGVVFSIRNYNEENCKNFIIRTDVLIDDKMIIFCYKNGIIVYDYLADRVKVRIDLTENNIPPIIGSGEFYLKNMINGYCVQIRNNEFMYDLNWNLVDNAVINLPIELDYIHPNMNNPYVRHDYKELNHHFNEYIISCCTVNGINNCIVISDKGNLIYPNTSFHSPLNRYLDSVCPNCFRNKFDILFGAQSSPNPQYSEYISVRSPKNISHIVDTKRNCVMCEEIYDLDIQNAKFKGVKGLTDYAKRIIDMYSGIIE